MSSEMKKSEKIIKAIVGVDYDYICLIDRKTGSYEMFTGKTEERIPREKNNYDEERKQNTAVYVIEQDRERLLQEMDLEYVSEKLQQSDKFSTAYGMISNDGLCYKQDTFFYLDDTRQDVVLTRKDVTQLIHREQDDMNRLRKTLMELEQANEAKTEFLSNMSHDFRTPLNGILGFAEIGLEEPETEKKQQSLEKIKLAGSLLLDLVNDTLELSRIESGKMKLEIRPFECREILEPVRVSIQRLAEAEKIHFVPDVKDAPGGRMQGDCLKIQKIVLNLLSNAVKFTPAGGRVGYTLQAIDPPVSGMTLRIVVEDSGIGMSREFLQHLYEPFSQERRPEAIRKEGTGLGLSIVKHMVDMMHGTIAVDSQAGKGTRFTVELPLAADDRMDSQEQKEEELAIDENVLAGRRILLCEDNEMNTELASILLQEKKMVVECAADGKEGVEKFAASAEGYYDAILMDIRMPVMDGYQAARLIRKLDRRDAATVPMIALTADAFEESLKAAVNAGMNHFLTKPFDPKKLYELLEQTIRQKEKGEQG